MFRFTRPVFSAMIHPTNPIKQMPFFAQRTNAIPMDQNAQMLENIKRMLENPEKYNLKEVVIDADTMARFKDETEAMKKYSAY